MTFSDITYASVYSQGAATILRCPIIPGCNDREDHLAGIAATANRLRCIQRVEVEPYHPLGKSKAALLERDYALGDLSFPEETTAQSWIDVIAARTAVPVWKG